MSQSSPLGRKTGRGSGWNRAYDGSRETRVIMLLVTTWETDTVIERPSWRSSSRFKSFDYAFPWKESEISEIYPKWYPYNRRTVSGSLVGLFKVFWQGTFLEYLNGSFSPPYSILQIVKSYPFVYLQPKKDTPLTGPPLGHYREYPRPSPRGWFRSQITIQVTHIVYKKNKKKNNVYRLLIQKQNSMY